MTAEESSLQTGQERENNPTKKSLIQNHVLRGPTESFWDAMEQGRTAKGAECRAMIADILKKPSDA
jgi:hypothetical protein